MAGHTMLVDDERFMIVRVDHPDGRVSFRGEADLRVISGQEIRDRAKEHGLILTYIDIPLHGETLAWSDLHFVRREVP